MRSSRAAICASKAAELLLMVEVFLSSVESVASSWFSKIFICASMSSFCFCVAAPSLSIFSTRRSSFFCFTICSRNEATCFFTSGREVSNADCCATSCLRCRCNCTLSIAPTIWLASTAIPSSTSKLRIRPVASDDITTSVASNVPCASNSVSVPHDAASTTAAIYTIRFISY